MPCGPLLGDMWDGQAGAPPAPVASFLQPPKDDAAIVGAVRLFSVLIAAVTMDLAGRKVLLFVSGELLRPPPAAPGRWLAQAEGTVAGSSGVEVWVVTPTLWVLPPASAQHGARHTPATPGRSAGLRGANSGYDPSLDVQAELTYSTGSVRSRPWWRPG